MLWFMGSQSGTRLSDGTELRAFSVSGLIFNSLIHLS